MILSFVLECFLVYQHYQDLVLLLLDFPTPHYDVHHIKADGKKSNAAKHWNLYQNVSDLPYW